jgi:hypothetical protein
MFMRYIQRAFNPKEIDMPIPFNFYFLNPLKNISVIAVTFIVFFLPTTSAATVIDFDDLNPVYDEEFPSWSDNPLTDQYRDQGLLISGAWVNGANSENVMLTSNAATLEFVGDLPTFVSMNITSHYGDAIFLDFIGTSGQLHSITTSGWQGLEEYSTPVIPNEFISFSSDEGIRFINIQGFYNMRIGASVDNLTFTHTSIPEPASVVLIALGMIGILIRRYRFK